ncbi:hypothetical protein MCOR31_002111 [Pyricularia oryzae]|nr:hypothetical protein MCOR31_002111 [Pyricularia oryzae]KAI6417738.1 hypothetical protein MCOR20_000229 [Pyricularia oryzae]KAI6521470.1 hypothetical protein MCOR10_005938 [Pyricularia oryzae]KAI6537806.1 hypothetical protein MCOR05_005202 [Pyricularia oryzae]
MASKKWLKLWTESEEEANTTLLHTWNLLHHHEPERRAVPVPLEMTCFKHAKTGNVEQAWPKESVAERLPLLFRLRCGVPLHNRGCSVDLEYLSIPRDHFEKLVKLTAESVQGISTALLVGNARDKPGFPKAKDDASWVPKLAENRARTMVR